MEQAVIVHFSYGSTDFGPFFTFEEKLENLVERSGLGDYDGNELAVSGEDGYLWMYGPDADKLYEAVLPLLRATKFMHGAEVRLRYGPPEDGVKEVEVVVEP